MSLWVLKRAKGPRLEMREHLEEMLLDVWGLRDGSVLFQGEKGITKDLSNLTEAGSEMQQCLCKEVTEEACDHEKVRTISGRHQVTVL